MGYDFTEPRGVDANGVTFGRGDRMYSVAGPYAGNPGFVQDIACYGRVAVTAFAIPVPGGGSCVRIVPCSCLMRPEAVSS